MTAPLGVNVFAKVAQDAEKVVAAWLSPLRRSGVAREYNDPLPYTLIRRVAGTEDPCTEMANPVVSVHTLCDKSLGYENASNETQLTHRRMLYLERSRPTITLPDSTIVAVDYVSVFMMPIAVPYEDLQILRQVARYTIGLCYDYVPS